MTFEPDEQTNRRNTGAGPEKTIASLVAAASLALGVSGAFLAWRDSVSASIGAVSQSVAVLQASINASVNTRQRDVSDMEKLEAAIVLISERVQRLSEAVIRCERDAAGRK